MSEDRTKWEKIDQTELSKEFLEFYEKKGGLSYDRDGWVSRIAAWRGWCGAIEWMRSQATVVVETRDSCFCINHCDYACVYPEHCPHE